MNDDRRPAEFVSVDATLAAHTAGRMLDAALDLDAALRPPGPSRLSELDIDDDACGTLPGGGALRRAHQDSADEVADLLARLRAVLEGDAERLYQVAARVAWTDTTVAARFGGR